MKNNKGGNNAIAFNWVVALFIGISLVAQACRTGKGAVSRHDKVENLSHNRLIDSISKYHLKFETFSTKASSEIKSTDLNESFKTNLKIRRDSLVWMSISKAGIVAYNVVISPDTIIGANKLKKKYFAHGFNFVNDLFHTELDYFMLQDLLIGNLINFDPSEKYKMKEDTSYYFVSTIGKRRMKRAFEKERVQKKEPYIYRYWIYPGIFRPAKTIINDLEDSITLEVNYLQYEMVDSVLVPSDIMIIASSPQKRAELQLKFKGSRINELTEFPFKIPEGYEKVD